MKLSGTSQRSLLTRGSVRRPTLKKELCKLHLNCIQIVTEFLSEILRKQTVAANSQ